jgi:hypothetical protein
VWGRATAHFLLVVVRGSNERVDGGGRMDMLRDDDGLLTTSRRCLVPTRWAEPARLRACLVGLDEVVLVGWGEPDRA